jgi:serine protease Do
VIDSRRIITNAHVVQGQLHEVEDWEGRRLEASLLKLDRTQDLALLETTSSLGTPAMLGDSDLLQPGTPVVAVGNPLGFVGAISTGIVHRVTRHDWICSDVRLAPGNSGGPLADFQGRVIGLNTMIAAGGLAFAISSRVLQRFLTRAATGMELGVTVRQVRLRNGAAALLLLELTPGGAAEQASLLPGDLLIAANGKRIFQANDLLEAITAASRGLLELTFYRTHHDRPRLVMVKLSETVRANAA